MPFRALASLQEGQTTSGTPQDPKGTPFPTDLPHRASFGLLTSCRFDWKTNRADAVLRPQRNGRPRDDSLPRYQLESKPLGNGRQDQHGLEHRKRIADTQPRPAAKWEIRELRNPLRQPVRPALGTKFERIVEVSGIVMQYPLAHQERGALRHLMAADHAIVLRPAADCVHRRIESHRLGNDVLRVCEPRHIGGGRGAAAEHRN